MHGAMYDRLADTAMLVLLTSCHGLCYAAYSATHMRPYKCKR